MFFHPSSGVEPSTAGTAETTMPPAEPFCASSGFSVIRCSSILGWVCDHSGHTNRQPVYGQIIAEFVVVSRVIVKKTNLLHKIFLLKIREKEKIRKKKIKKRVKKFVGFR